MFIDTFGLSTAVWSINLPLWKRGSQITWQSGTVSTYQVKRRHQLAFLVMNAAAPQTVSYGRFANWAKNGATFA